MKQFLTVLLIVSFIVSCSFESYVPIDKPSVKIDPEFLGSWNGKSTGELEDQHQANENWIMTRQDDYIYNIFIKKENPAESHKMMGYISLVNGQIFMNVYDDIPKGSPRGYYLFKLVKIDRNTIKLYPVTEDIREKFSTSNELKTFIAANMMNSYFFQKPYLCTRTTTK